MSVRRRIENLKAAAAARGDDSRPRVWVVLPANGRDDHPHPGTPVVNGPVAIVPQHWVPDQTDAYLGRLSGGRPDKVVFGVDYDKL